MRTRTGKMRQQVAPLIGSAWEEIAKPQADGAQVMRLFDEERDPISVMKWKETLDFLEEATDRCEDVANVIEGVIVKNG